MTHKGTATLKTERLILRRFTPDDAEAVFENWASDPEVTKYLGWYPHKSPNATRELLTTWCGNYKSPQVYNWAIVPRDLGEPIGSITSVELDEAAQCIEIGYCMGKAWWRKGIMPEAFTAVIRYLFEEVGVNRIQAGYNPLNGASGAVMRKCGLKYEGTERQCRVYKGKLIDHTFYAILAKDYFGSARKTQEPDTSNVATLKTSADLMFYNLHIAMDTVDWNADVCGAPAWRYIYHTLHSADKWFINPSTRNDEPEPAFHTPGLDWPDNPSGTVLGRDTLYAYYEQVRQKILGYLNSLNDSQLNECPKGCTGTRLGLALSQFRHMYAHIGILNGITIANTQQYPRVINESAWRSGRLPEGLYDVEERK